MEIFLLTFLFVLLIVIIFVLAGYRKITIRFTKWFELNGEK